MAAAFAGALGALAQPLHGGAPSRVLDLGGELVDRAVAIETELLSVPAHPKPGAVIVTNVEYYAAVVLHLAGLPQEAFTSTFTASRIVGGGAHILEQAADNKIIRPSARYIAA